LRPSGFQDRRDRPLCHLSGSAPDARERVGVPSRHNAKKSVRPNSVDAAPRAFTAAAVTAVVTAADVAGVAAANRAAARRDRVAGSPAIPCGASSRACEGASIREAFAAQRGAEERAEGLAEDELLGGGGNLRAKHAALLRSEAAVASVAAVEHARGAKFAHREFHLAGHGIAATEVGVDARVRADGAQAEVAIAAGVAADERRGGVARGERDEFHRVGSPGRLPAP
jgi:hypothetical protein